MKLALRPLKLNLQKPETGFILKPWQQHGLALLLFALLTFWLLNPVLINAGRSLEQWGDALLQTWTLDWDAYAFRHNPLALFNANAFYPYRNSLAFSESLVGQAFLVAPVIWVTDNPVLAFNLLSLASFILSGWGVYLLVFGLTGRFTPALVAGLIFAFFPNRFEQLSHLHLLSTEWMPFCLLFLRRFLNNWRWGDGLVFSLLLALELLSSTYLGLFLVVVIGLYLLYRGVLNYRALAGFKSFNFRSLSSLPGFSRAARLSVVLLLSILAVLPFLWPYLEVQRDLGFERGQAEVISWSAQPFYFLDPPKENKLNQWLYKPLLKQDWWTGGGGERSLYLGGLASLLALVGMVTAWKCRKVLKDGPYFILLALISASFTFGPSWQSGRFGSLPLPYALLYNFVPGFQGLRVPVRFIYVVALAVAVLAGLAVSALQDRFKLTTFPKAALLGAALIGLLCLEYASDVSVNESGILRSEPPPVSKWLAVHSPGPVLNVPLSGSDNSNLFYQYWSRGSWNPVMNGFSGFMPPAYDALKTAVAGEGFSPRIVELLQGLEVRYIVVDSTDSSVRPNWEKLKGQLDKISGGEAAHLGGSFIYALPDNSWLRRLAEKNFNPSTPVAFVEYRRNDPLLLELPAYFLESRGWINPSKLSGNIQVGFRPLPPPPANTPAEWLFLQAGEDPTLYGFRPEDRLEGNHLVDLYRRSSSLLARADYSSSGGLSGKQFLQVKGKELAFSKPGTVPEGRAGNRYVRFSLAALTPQTLKINSGAGFTEIKLEPGLSRLDLPVGEDSGLALELGEIYLLNAELWDGTSPDLNQPILRPSVVLLEASTSRSGDSGLANLRIAAGNKTLNYTATLDVYNYPWGAHPSGHYGYWSVPVQGKDEANLKYGLELGPKKVTTYLNGQEVPNYPPDPAQFDITRYGKTGDFRASLNLYAGEVLAGSVRLFDFTLYSQGDKNRLDNRRVGAFKGYNSPLILLVLPGERNRN